jgi:hypothetical protein
VAMVFMSRPARPAEHSCVITTSVPMCNLMCGRQALPGT